MKGTVVGSHMEDSDVTPVQLEDGTIEIIENFPYLGSNIANDGKLVSCSIVCQCQQSK